LPPATAWRTWLILAGRGWGKTRTGAEWVCQLAESGKAKRIALVARTTPDVRDVMVMGESGILAISPPWNKPKYERTMRRIIWPSGTIATTYSSEEPDQLRGPQHDAAWADELATWRYEDAWSNLRLGLRLGTDPRCVVTTTPRPTKTIKQLAAAPDTVVTRGSTYENRGNMADAFFDTIIRQYEGTRLGRQELHAEILDDNPNAMWSRDTLDDCRRIALPALQRVVVAVDPQAGDMEAVNGAETGIVAAGLGEDGHAYVIDDASLRASPAEWARQVVAVYHKHRCDRIIAETNQGGAMVQHTIRTADASVSYKGVHAKRGKHLRAEPVAALYEQRRVHHVGTFAALEDQMCEWTPGDESPDRLDALVYAITELMLNRTQGEFH